MTRFARSIGSKASNKKEPDEPTPWFEMKQQLEEALSKEKHHKNQTKTKSARELLKEQDNLYYSNNLGNVNTEWAEFDAPRNKSDIKNSKVEKKSKGLKQKVKKAIKQTITEESIVSLNLGNVKTNKDKEISASEQSNNNVQSVLKQNKLKRKENIEKDKSNNCDSNAIKDKKKKYKKEVEASMESSNKQNITLDSKSENETEQSEGCNKLTKRQKRNQKKQNQKIEQDKGDSDNNGTKFFNIKGNDWDVSVKFEEQKFNGNNDNKVINDKGQSKKRKWMSDFDWKNWRRFGDNIPKKYQKKVAKVRDEKEYKRRKPEESSMKMTINGIDVEIVKYDGYPVKKEDAERLKILRKQMILKGIPTADINEAMKLERRKCEKALARIRKQVCFHCRKAGHNLSDCPELGREESATGICFKCGSTEHTHFECKVTKSDDYRYAKCFICREQGHIAKQCPDNAKGLYPDGGCCKTCGDVTHLRKDCPDTVVERDEKNIKLDTIKDDNLESLDNEIVKNKPEVKPTKKIVKF